jgi:putative transposase
MIEAEHPVLSVRRQCGLLALTRSGLYYEPQGESPENLALMRLVDEAYTAWPFYGVRKMTAHLEREGQAVNVKRVRRLMRLMGLEAIYPRKRLSVPGEGHKRYPYLLRGVEIVRPDQVWSADITYLRLRRGFLYLAAILDWHSRYVLSWTLSSSLDAAFCVWALEEALARGRPEVFNTDQGVQFTSEGFTGILESRGIAISMDGRGRVFDNIFSERLWRTVKYEEVYLKDYADPREAREGLRAYFRFYNEQRLHQALDYRTPAEVYEGRAGGERDRAAARTVAGTPVALRAPSVPATVGL